MNIKADGITSPVLPGYRRARTRLASASWMLMGIWSSIIEMVARNTGVSLHDYRRTTTVRHYYPPEISWLPRLCRVCRPPGPESRGGRATPGVRHHQVEPLLRDQPVFDRLRDRQFSRSWRPGAMGSSRYGARAAPEARSHIRWRYSSREVATKDRLTEILICGSDVDESSLAAARTGVYPHSSLEGVPAHVMATYFTSESGRLGLSHRLNDGVAGDVRFLRHDLLGDQALPTGAHFDLVLCRNVLIYFGREAQSRVFDLLASSLAPGGYLCLGEAEQLPPNYSRLFRDRGPKGQDLQQEVGGWGEGVDGETGGVGDGEKDEHGRARTDTDGHGGGVGGCGTSIYPLFGSGSKRVVPQIPYASSCPLTRASTRPRSSRRPWVPAFAGMTG